MDNYKEQIRGMPTQELIAYAIAQTELNKSLERENTTLKRSVEYQCRIGDDIMSLRRDVSKSKSTIQKLQLLVGYLCKKQGITRIGITDDDFFETCNGHQVYIRDSENYGGDKIIEIVVK